MDKIDKRIKIYIHGRKNHGQNHNQQSNDDGISTFYLRISFPNLIVVTKEILES